MKKIREIIYILIMLLCVVPLHSATEGTGFWTNEGENTTSGEASILATFDMKGIKDTVNIGFAKDLEKDFPDGITVESEITPVKAIELKDSDANGEATYEDGTLYLYYQTISKTPLTLTVSITSPLVAEEDATQKLGWDVRFPDNELSTMTLHANDDGSKGWEIPLNDNVSGENGKVGSAGSVELNITTSNDEDDSYLIKPEGLYYGYIYLEITADGGGNA